MSARHSDRVWCRLVGPDGMLLQVTTWVERSPVHAAMLNPALLAAVTAAAAEEYTRLSGDAMPYSYAYLVAPLVLHRDTRDALPRRIDSFVATWLTRHPALAAGFPARARSLTEPVREGIRFGLATGAILLTDAGGLQGSLAQRARPAKVGDIAAVLGNAGFVGRWLTRLDRPATAFALLGVAP